MCTSIKILTLGNAQHLLPRYFLLVTIATSRWLVGVLRCHPLTAVAAAAAAATAAAAAAAATTAAAASDKPSKVRPTGHRCRCRRRCRHPRLCGWPRPNVRARHARGSAKRRRRRRRRRHGQ
ncbi:unnamed protein product [Ectocarpus sp. 12 AP-2014]